MFKWVKAIREAIHYFFKKRQEEMLTIMFVPHSGAEAFHFQVNYLHFYYFLILLLLSVSLSGISYWQNQKLVKQKKNLSAEHKRDRKVIDEFKKRYSRLGGVIFNIQKDAQDIYEIPKQAKVHTQEEMLYWFGNQTISWSDKFGNIFEKQRMSIRDLHRRLRGAMALMQPPKRFMKNYEHFNPHKINLIPLDGYLVRGFDLEIPHTGIDLAAPKHTPIYAAASGRVSLSGVKGNYGKLVILVHKNGKKTFYAHNTRLNVSVGDWVEKGEVVSFVGTTGRSTGDHLHFEVRVNNVPVDPYPYIGHFIKPSRVNPEFWKKNNPLFGIGYN